MITITNSAHHKHHTNIKYETNFSLTRFWPVRMFWYIYIYIFDIIHLISQFIKYKFNDWLIKLNYLIFYICYYIYLKNICWNFFFSIYMSSHLFYVTNKSTFTTLEKERIKSWKYILFELEIKNEDFTWYK